jgi:toxin ParE1/3/4
VTKFRVAPLAKSDLDEIWDYLARQGGIELADRMADSITNCFPMLARMPNSGRARTEISAYMRSFSIGKYLIYYENPPKGRIVIARVLYGSRDQRAAFLLDLE